VTLSKEALVLGTEQVSQHVREISTADGTLHPKSQTSDKANGGLDTTTGGTTQPSRTVCNSTPKAVSSDSETHRTPEPMDPDGGNGRVTKNSGSTSLTDQLRQENSGSTPRRPSGSRVQRDTHG